MMEQHVLSWEATADSPSYADRETERLIQSCLMGDEVAYAALYQLHSGPIYRLAYSLLQQKEDAEEVLQDSFEYAFRQLAQYDAHKASFKTWLYRITISRCRNKRRRKWLPTFSLGQLMGAEVADKETPALAEKVLLTEQQQQVWLALQALSPKLRETAVLRYYEGLTYNEIGDILNVPPKTVESRMRLAHKALRECLGAVIG